MIDDYALSAPLVAIIAGVLAQRFRFVHNRADKVFEQLEQCLLFAAERLGTRGYLVGEQFTAADLTLAALMRPVSLVPYFREHPRLQRLFEWRAPLLREHGREPRVGYESALQDTRRRRRWSLGAVRWLPASMRAERSALTEVPALPTAYNDQQPVRRFPMVTGPLWYARLVWTCGLRRKVSDG